MPVQRDSHPAGPRLVAICVTMLLLACSHGERTATDTTASAASPPNAAGASSAAADSTARPGRAIVRGRVASMNDTALTVTTRDGAVSVTLMPPVTVYTRLPATLADVRANTFVGVTSVPDPDGSQHATEIHIFPEALRGMGEGSYPLPQSGGSRSTARSTMTNGSVTAGGAASSSRMTNGAASVHPGGTITVTYKGGVQTIKVPAGVPVSLIAPAHRKLTPGASVSVVAMKGPTGALRSSTIFLSDSGARH